MQKSWSVQRLILALCALLVLLPACSDARPGFGTVGLRHHASTGAITPTLGPLTISPSTYTIGTAQGGVILGATPTSTITATGLPSFFTFNSGLRTISYDGTGTAGPGSFSFIETLAGANGSPKTSTINYTLVSGGIALLFDQSIGNGVDQNGFASLPLRVGANRYYLNSSTGSDSNSCTAAKSPSTPKATQASVLACVTDGQGDQILVAEGTSYTGSPPDFSFYAGGYSLQYPAVVQSYDPTDPTNEAKFGHANGTGSHARPVFSGILNMIGGDQHNIVWRGLDINPGNISGQASGGTYVRGGLLFENNIAHFSGFGLSVNDRPLANHWIFRNNAIFGIWAPNNQGIYASGITGLTIEDNVFYHSGWKIGASRDDDPNLGGASIYSHAIYQQHPSNGIVRRNLFADNSADCGSLRGDATVQDNVYLKCPISIAAGGGVRADLTVPFGDQLTISHNAALDGIDVNSQTSPLDGRRGWGISTDNGKSTSYAGYNVFAHNTATSGGRNTFGTISADGEQSTMLYDNNRAFAWTPSGQTFAITPTGDTTHNHPTYTNNVWDDPASGSNVNVSSITFPNSSLDTAALAVAAGYADYTAMINYAIANPEAHIQRGLLTMIMSAYGQTGPPLQDLAIDFGPWRTGNIDGGTIGRTQPESTIVPGGAWPTGLSIDPNTRTWYLDGTQSAGSGTGTLTETPAGGGTPHVTTINWTVGTAPQLSSLSATPGSGAATINVTTSLGNGTLYWVLDDLNDTEDCNNTPYCSPMYPGEVKGCAHSHYSIPVCGSQAVATSGVQTINVSGLTAGKDYYASIMQVSAAGVWSPTTNGLYALGPVHVVPTAGAHAYRYFRLYVTAGQSPGVALAEIEFATSTGGTNVATGQTYTSSSYYTGETPNDTPDRAFDADTSTYWASNFSNTWPQWIQVDYGPTSSNWKALKELRLVPRSGFPDQGPAAFNFQGSDDGSTWTNLVSSSGESWSTSTTRTYAIP